MAERVGFEGTLRTGHKGPAVEIPFDPATTWGIRPVPLWPGRRGFPVEVLLNGVRFRSAIVSRQGRYFVLVDESLARRAGSRAGTRVKLTVWADRAAPSGDVVSAPPATRPRSVRGRGTTWKRLCASALALPGVEEGTSYSTPALRVRKTLLARLREDGESVAVRVDPLDRDVLLAADPRAFFVTDHYLAYPWVLVRLAEVPHPAVIELLQQAWRRAAPRRLVAGHSGARSEAVGGAHARRRAGRSRKASGARS